MKKNGVIFDLDGTLWEVIDSTYYSANAIVGKYNLKMISKEMICKVFGSSKKEAAKLYFPYLETNEAMKLVDEISMININNLKKNGGNIYPDLIDVLNELDKEYSLFIVSNTSKTEYIEAFLDSSNTKKCFKDYIAASKIGITKEEAIKRIIYENKIEKAVYIGDTNIDFEAAQKNNIPFILAKYGFGQDIQTEYYINNLKELPKLLKKVF